jgi:hypothetical protein
MESVVEYLLNHHDKFLYLLAGLSLVVELAIVGLSGPLLFFAIGCAVSGLLVTIGLIDSWELEVLSVGLISASSAVALWKPLRKFQGSSLVGDSSSDMIGKIVPVSEEVTALGGSIRYSGINWQAKLHENSSEDPLQKDTRVVITAVSGNVMIVRRPGADTKFERSS